MNKPAPQEPSMDEILSSIRQIIADDDAGARRPAASEPAVPPSPVTPMATPPVRSAPAPAAEAPLALSPAQIVKPDSGRDDDKDPTPASPPLSYQSILARDGAKPEPSASPEEAQLVDPEDVAFEPDPAPAPAPSFASRPARPSASVARVAPMPDPKLSADLAERLIEPATRAAVQQNFARLNSMSQVPAGQTIDGMMRDMLRPMLKAWLDEHLPSVVERMVEKEIARISRGVE